MTVSVATRILITNLRQIDLSKVCLINLVNVSDRRTSSGQYVIVSFTGPAGPPS